MGGFIALSVLSSLGALGIVVAAVALALPVGWLVMLIDALLRDECDYPGATATSQNKLLWVLLIVFVHVSAIAYFFIVFRTPRRQYAQPASAAA